MVDLTPSGRVAGKILFLVATRKCKSGWRNLQKDLQSAFVVGRFLEVVKVSHE